MTTPPPTTAPLNEDTLRAAVQTAYLEVAKGKLERADKAAERVATAAAGVGTIYAAVLALVYTADPKATREFPPRAIAPAILLGVAFFLSVYSVAYSRSGRRTFDLIKPATTWQDQQERLLAFLQWMDRGARAGTWAIRSAVIFLGAAVVLLPVAFVDLSVNVVWFVTAAAIGYTAMDLIIARREGEPAANEVPGPEARV